MLMILIVWIEFSVNKNKYNSMLTRARNHKYTYGNNVEWD
jgi:hypothetical protein